MTFWFGKVNFNNISFYYYIVERKGYIRVIQQKTDCLMRQILCVAIAILIFVFFLFPGCRISAQVVSMPSSNDTANNPVWAKMMMDPGGNFFSTVSAFEKYRKNRPGESGYGWNLFKRWEYLMRGRVAADGTFPAPDAVFNAWNSFKQTSRSPAGNWVSLGPSTAPAYGAATGYLGIGRLNVSFSIHRTRTKFMQGPHPAGFGLQTTTAQPGVAKPITCQHWAYRPLLLIFQIQITYYWVPAIAIMGMRPGWGFLQAMTGEQPGLPPKPEWETLPFAN